MAETINFIEKIIIDDLEKGRIKNNKIVTRFPPEPNGYLHIGHIKSICLNFGLAKKYNGVCHLRFDDTNPEKEDKEYIESIKSNIKWLGFDWGKNEYYASDYYDKLYSIAVHLIEKGLAYVDGQTPEEVKANRGTLTEPGINSPDRDRSVSENLRLFNEMKEGLHPEGKYLLRAKLDMSSPNINMRDPALYRIKYAVHPRTGDKWCIYPMYDFTHPISDAIEGITHSLCTLEFEDHRPAYDWACSIDEIEHTPHQYEFARLNISYTVMSKRKLLNLVKLGLVSGWDDPRMPTISGIIRRGYSPESMIDFINKIGIAKVESVVDFSLMEFCVRDDLNKRATRIMAVLDPVKLIIDNYPEDKTEYFELTDNPEDPDSEKHLISFSRELFIEREDFMEEPIKGYHRLYIGNEVRLKSAYYVTAVSIKKDTDGKITEIHALYDPESRGGETPDKRKVKGTSHWVNAKDSLNAEIRLYDKLFKNPNPGEKTGNYLDDLNENSLKILENAKIETFVTKSKSKYFQFIRNGYFTPDKDSTPSKLIYNRTVTLKDSWAKIKAKN